MGGTRGDGGAGGRGEGTRPSSPPLPTSIPAEHGGQADQEDQPGHGDRDALLAGAVPGSHHRQRRWDPPARRPQGPPRPLHAAVGTSSPGDKRPQGCSAVGMRRWGPAKPYRHAAWGRPARGGSPTLGDTRPLGSCTLGTRALGPWTLGDTILGLCTLGTSTLGPPPQDQAPEGHHPGDKQPWDQAPWGHHPGTVHPWDEHPGTMHPWGQRPWG